MNESCVSLRHQELLFIQGYPGWSLKDSPIVFFLRGCDLNRGMPLIRHSLEESFLLIVQVSRFMYWAIKIPVLFILPAFRQLGLVNRDYHLF